MGSVVEAVSPRHASEDKQEESETNSTHSSPLTNQTQTPKSGGAEKPKELEQQNGTPENESQPKVKKTETEAPKNEPKSNTTTPTPHDSACPTSPTSSHTPTTTPTSNAPKWVQDFMDAAASGMSELRKEVRNVIESGKGKELEKLLTDMQEKAPKEMRGGMGEMVKAVKTWIEHPEELEEGGRWWAVWCPTVLMEVWTLVYAPVVQAWDWLCPATAVSGGFSGTANASTMGKTTTYTRIW